MAIESIGTIKQTKSKEQLGVLVLDGSGSMGAQGETGDIKAAEVSIAVRSLISKLKTSSKAADFYLSIVMYDNNIEERLDPTSVASINDTDDYNPINSHGGETAIGDALEKAYEISNKYLSEPTQFRRTAVIILMTDGQNNSGSDPVDVALKIKNSEKPIVINAVGYGKDTEIDKSTLEKIVSISNGKTTYTRDPEELRKFFDASMTQPIL